MNTILFSGEAREAGTTVKDNEVLTTSNKINGTADSCAEVKDEAQELIDTISVPTPPPLPEHLPAMLEVLATAVGDEAVWPSLFMGAITALSCRFGSARFRLYTGEEHEATLAHLTVANAGSGKGYKVDVVNVINQDLRIEDQQAAEAFEAQLAEMRAKRKSGEEASVKLVFPQNHISYNSSQSGIVQACKNADGLRMLLMVEEITSLAHYHLISDGKNNDILAPIIKTWDCDLISATRATSSGVVGSAVYRVNLDASCVPSTLGKLFANRYNDGAISRLLMTTIPDADPYGAKPRPVVRPLGEEFYAELRPFVLRLEQIRQKAKSFKGLYIEAPQELHTLIRHTDEVLQATKRPIHSPLWNEIVNRLPVLLHIVGMTLYTTNGYQWSGEIEAYCVYVLLHDLWCKHHYFSQILAPKAPQPAVEMPKTRLLDEFDDIFDEEAAIDKFKRRGKTAKQAKNWIDQNVSRGNLIRQSDGTLVKSGLIVYVND